ncbi:MAG: Ig-like domain-containing protein, partial [Deltaproteobacteria bacterium]
AYTTGAVTANCSVFATFRDILVPTLTLSALPNGSYTNNKTLNMAGIVSDNEGVKSLTINGIDASFNLDGSFSQATPLVEGPNTITTTVKDNAGNETTDTRIINYDPIAPILTVTTPADNSKTKEKTATLSGSINETAVVTVKVNNNASQNVPMTGDVFTLPISLISGAMNTVIVSATDMAGNTTSEKRTVTCDDASPSLAITQPVQDMATNQKTITLTGTVTDLTNITITIAMDGKTYISPVTNGTFSQPLAFTAEKTYAIVVTATDEAGNTSVVQRNIVYDASIDFTINPVTSPTNQMSQTITGTREANATITVTCPTASAGTVSYPTETTWSVTLTDLSLDSNTITVTATDRAVNEMSKQVTIVVDTTIKQAVINGAPPFITKVTSAALTISGTGITAYKYKLDDASYSEETPVATPITLTNLIDGTHIVSVIGRDAAGNWQPEATPTTATWTIDTAAPSASATINNGNPVTGSTPVPVSFTAPSDTVTFRTSIDGNTWSEQAYTGNFSWSLPSGDGTKTIYAQFKDTTGNWSGSYSYTITLDTTAPVLTVSTLSSGSYTNNRTLNISGTATDATSGMKSLTVNNASVPLQNSVFSHAVTLAQGINTITTVATDNANNAATDTRTIVYDASAPVLILTAPADNTVTSQSTVTITGTVDETSTVSITINNGTETPLQVNNNTFTVSPSLTYGINTVEVTATDRAGNTSSAKRTIVYDNVNPSVTTTDPAQDMATNQSTITLKGEVTDITISIVAIMDNVQTYMPSLTNVKFEQVLSFTTERTYPVMVKATDQAGNETVVTRNITYDITIPSLTISPVITPTNVNNQKVTGTREANTTVSVTCPSAQASIIYPAPTTWEAYVINLTEGENIFTITSTDTAGNTRTTTFTLRFDSTDPVTRASPGGSTFASSQIITLTCSDTGSGCDKTFYTTDGSDPTETSPVYTSSIPITTMTTLKFRSIDAAGNKETIKTETYTINMTPQPASTTFSLSSGWNFISIPIQPTYPSIETVLTDISLNVRVVWGYNNQNKIWLKYAPNSELRTPNSLDNVESGKGYWMYINSPATLTVTGKDVSPAITLSAGWNLVGYGGSDNTQITDAYISSSGLADKWLIIWGWENGQWYAKPNPSLNYSTTQPLDSLYRGKAYWIKTTEGVVWQQ